MIQIRTTTRIPATTKYQNQLNKNPVCIAFPYSWSLCYSSFYHQVRIQTIDYIKATSPELPFYRELKKANRQEDLFNKVGSMLRNQKVNEENADNSISSGEIVFSAWITGCFSHLSEK